MTPTDLQAGCATGVIEYVQGTRKNGTPITLSRTNPLNALGIPQGTDVVNFVSLGFGGYLVVELDFAKFNQVGWDLQITETSYGNPQCQSYPEKVFIEVSKDLTNWVYVDILCLDGYVDVQFIDWFKYVRLTDRSAATKFSGSADGYDVDGVTVFNSGPLPIELKYFGIDYENPYLNIRIVTASEANTDKLVVESSIDASNFDYLTEFQAAGNSSFERQYDKKLIFEPQSEITYFRLIEIDFDGKKFEFEMTVVNTKKLDPIEMYYFDLLGRKVNSNDAIFKVKK